VSANGQPTVEAVTAIVRHGDLIALLDRRNAYSDSDFSPAWKVSVQPKRGADVIGYRDTFEGAQALAVQLLELTERHREAVKAEHAAFAAMVDLANTRPARADAPAVTDDQDPDGEPPF
jgi:hypothetical protein